MATYDEKDYVEVVDGDGHPVEGFAAPVPKQWVGTDLLPPGTKAKSRRSAKNSADGGDDKTGPEGS